MNRCGRCEGCLTGAVCYAWPVTTADMSVLWPHGEPPERVYTEDARAAERERRDEAERALAAHRRVAYHPAEPVDVSAAPAEPEQSTEPAEPEPIDDATAYRLFTRWLLAATRGKRP